MIKDFLPDILYVDNNTRHTHSRFYLGSVGTEGVGVCVLITDAGEATAMKCIMSTRVILGPAQCHFAQVSDVLYGFLASKEVII